MPWRALSVRDQRREFVGLAMSGTVGIAELCRRFGISREAGYRWLRRYRAEGEAGLTERSRRPHGSPRRTGREMEGEVLAVRVEHPGWGGRKIVRRLGDLGQDGVPAPSTVTEILRRHGRLDAAECARHRAFERFERNCPNELWQMDFKGHFALRVGRCHALTVLDDHSRYAIGLRACGDETDGTVRGQLTGLFRHYGLPEAILADNGPPWGTAGHPEARYSALGVWLLQLGIALHHGRPRHPQTHGKDERFHRTLDVELLQHNQFADQIACQVAFDCWRVIYNEERPHQALGMDVPAKHYRPSTRAFPETLPEPEYAVSDLLRRVTADGYVSFKGRRHKMSQAFAGHVVALRPTRTDGLWSVFFSRFAVAQITLGETKALPQEQIA